MQYYNYIGKVSMQTREFEECGIDATRIVAGVKAPSDGKSEVAVRM